VPPEETQSRHPPRGAETTALGDRDRNRLAEALGRHYVEGRLDADQLDQRLEMAYQARSAQQARQAMVNLPPLQPQGRPRRRGRRRHGESSVPQAGWLPSTERFRDPTTQRVMRVWVDPGDGARHYIAETDS